MRCTHRSIQSVIRCSTLTIDNVSGSVGEAYIKVTRVHEMHQRDIACAGRVSRCRERALAGRSLELRQCTSSDTRQESTQYQNRNDASRGTRPSHGTFYTVLHVGCFMDSSPVCHTAHRLEAVCQQHKLGRGRLSPNEQIDRYRCC